ncbi:hypothetical protein POUND7_004761 [Theobroma cacao]
MINGTHINTTITNTSANEGSPLEDARKSVMDARAFTVFSTYNGLVLCSVICSIGLEPCQQEALTVPVLAMVYAIMQAIQLLYEINARNSKGKTALGTLQHQTKMDTRVVRQMLRKTRVSKPSSPKNTKTLANYLRSKTTFDERVAVYITRQRMKIAEDLRNALLVVAGVIVAATFHAVFSPPGSFRQENGNPTIMIDGTYSPVTDASASGESPSNDAGKSVMDNGEFIIFSTFNTFVLCTVIGILGLLLSDGLFGVNMMLMLIYLLVCYAVSIFVISPKMNIAVTDLVLLSLFIVFLYTVLLIYSRGKRKLQQLNYNANKCPKEALADEVQESGARTASDESSAQNITSA